MFEFFTALLGHPILFVIVLLVMMGFMCMTYEFILRLFGRKGGMGEGRSACLGVRYPDDTQDDPPPPMPVKVPASPVSPSDGKMERMKGIPNDDGSESENEYVFDPDWEENKAKYDFHETSKKKEG